MRGKSQTINEGARANVEQAKQAYAAIIEHARKLKAGGMTFDEVAAQLNSEGHTTRKGRPFKGTTVWRMLKRI